jgi:hypothetical protein
VLAVKVAETFFKMLDRELRKSPRIFTRNWGQPFFNRLFRMAGCQVASKADLMSKKAQQVTNFFFFVAFD